MAMFTKHCRVVTSTESSLCLLAQPISISILSFMFSFLQSLNRISNIV